MCVDIFVDLLPRDLRPDSSFMTMGRFIPEEENTEHIDSETLHRVIVNFIYFSVIWNSSINNV